MHPSYCSCSLIMILASTAAIVFPSIINGKPLGQVTIPTTTDNSHLSPVKRSVQFCGYRLINAMRSICAGKYAAGVSRRSDPVEYVDGDQSLDFHERKSNSLDVGSEYPPTNQYGTATDGLTFSINLDLIWPHNVNRTTNTTAFHREIPRLSSTSGRHRIRRNIIDECCRKTCAISEMRKYCGRQ